MYTRARARAHTHTHTHTHTHIHSPQSDARQIPVIQFLQPHPFSCPTCSLPELLGHLLCSPTPALNLLQFWAQTASPSESKAGTIGLTAREGRRGVTSTCRSPSPHDSWRSSESPAPSTRWSVWAHPKVEGSGFSPPGWFPFPTPYTLQGWAALPFGSRPCLAPPAFQSSLHGHPISDQLFSLSLTTVTPDPALHTRSPTPHSPKHTHTHTHTHTHPQSTPPPLCSRARVPAPS